MSVFVSERIFHDKHSTQYRNNVEAMIRSTPISVTCSFSVYVNIKILIQLTEGHHFPGKKGCTQAITDYSSPQDFSAAYTRKTKLQERQKINRLRNKQNQASGLAKQTSLHVHSLHDYDVIFRNFAIYEGRWKTQDSVSFSELGYGPYEFQSSKIRILVGRNGIISIRGVCK